MCKVSVIIPVYNGEKYLEDTLKSVSAQTLSEIEILCVDDGSTDHSWEILQQFAAQDSRIVLLKQKNAGAGAARNYGLKTAKGKYIAFIDSDDLYPSVHTLQMMYEAAEKNQALICGGSLNKLNGDNLITDPALFEPEYTFKQNGFINYADYQFDYGYWRFLYRRDFLLQNHIVFPNYRRQQDPPFFIKAMGEAGRFYALKDATYVYRVDHKKFVWTERNAIDMFSSIVESMGIAAKHQLDHLYCSLCDHLTTWSFQSAVAANLKSLAVQEIVKKVFSEIDYSILLRNHHPYTIPELYNVLIKSMDSHALVSVIIPVYNVEKYLDRCIQSVVGQTMPWLEIICVNDGSTDGSLAILEQWAEKDSRIRIINKENEGLSSARNRGIEAAQGEYLLFIDSDDWIEEDTVEEALSHMVRETDVVSWGAEIIAEGMEPYNNGVFRAKRYHKIRITGEHSITNDLLRDATYTVWNKLLKKSILEKYNISFTEKRLFEDNDFMFKYFVHCRKGFFVDRYLYHYIQRPNSIMEKVRANQSPQTIDFLYIFDSIYQHMEQFNLFDRWKKFMTQRYSSLLGQAYKYAPVNQKENIRNEATRFAKGYKDEHFTSNIVKDVRKKQYYKVRELNDIIVSLTSYPKRINTVSKTIISLIQQDEKPDKIILWLAESQFPNKEKDLPLGLLMLQTFGLDIEWCEDIRSYKKLIPTLRKYPEAIVITADDDAVYDRMWLKKLVESYIDDPFSVHCYRAHKVLLEGNKLASYRLWPKLVQPAHERSSYTYFFTGLGGVLYPPHCFTNEIFFNQALFMELCPYGDDIWFWGNAVCNNVRIHIVKTDREIFEITDGTQDVGLWHENIDNDRNDVQIEKMMKAFPQIIRNIEYGIQDESVLEQAVLDLKESKDQTTRDYQQLQFDFQSMQNSLSFRIGRAVTWLPRKFRGAWWCYRDHNLKYTIKRVIEHAGIDMGTGDFRRKR